MKTIWIVDGAYLLQACKPFGKIDYLRLKSQLELLNESPFFESYYLNTTSSPSTEEQIAFHTWLKSAPPRGPKMRVQLYELKEMQVVCQNCGSNFNRSIQKGVDVGVTTLILKLATQGLYDRVILTAGDGDFEDAIDYVKSELHKEIWICGLDGSVSADLQSYADKVIWLNDFWEKVKRLPERSGHVVNHV
jgi:uncharacterized LabA/DUF88 family protein